MKHVMDPIQEDHRAAERERNARYIDLEYECPVCGLEWRDTKPEPGFQRYCPDEDKHEKTT